MIGPLTPPADADKAALEAELLARARNLAPVLAERAMQAEHDRRVSAETHRDFREAGFYRVLQPARYGGMELDYGIQTAIARELGRGCASSAWVGVILACHSWIAGMYPDQAQADIWDDDPDVVIATSFLPVGVTVERIGEGLRISGRWRFSSGVDHCRWAILLVVVAPESGAGPPDPVFALVDLSSCRVEDTWRSAGLAATGSNDIVVEGVDIPPHRMMRVMETRGNPALGAPGAYLYRLPLFAVFPFNLVGPALGSARGALDAVAADLTNRQSAVGFDVSRVATVHQRLGRATALLDAADALIAQMLTEIISGGRGETAFEMMDRARYRLNLAHAVRSACEAVDELLPLTGGRGMETSHPMQRAWRDVHAVGQHIGMIWDIQAGLYGNVLLGHGSPDPKL